MNVFGTDFNYEGRLDKVRKLMDEQGIDVTLIFQWPNQYYLSGMYQPAPWYPIHVSLHTETPFILFKDPQKPPVFFITYLTSNGVKEGTWVKDVRVPDKEPYGKKPWYDYIAELLKERGVDRGTVGIEEDGCVLSTYKRLQSALPMAQFKGIDKIVEAVRLIKEPEEIKIIRESVAIAEASIEAGMKASKVGVLESDVQKAVEIEAKRLGAIKEIESFVLSGARTGLHRAGSTNWKTIENNDLVTIDFGCIYKGYGSDLCRTFLVGEPSAFQRKITDDLNMIRKKMIKMMKPGVMIRQLFDFGYSEMQNAGYKTDETVWPSGDTGWGTISIHGIGVSPMHDPPRAVEKDIKLESGVTFSFSLKARFVDFTIRYEDDLLVIPGGVELLNQRLPWQL